MIIKNEILRNVLISFFSGLLGAGMWVSVYPKFYVTKNTQSNIPDYSKTAKATTNTSTMQANVDFVTASASSTKSVVFIKTLSDNRYSEGDLFDFYFGGSQQRQVVGSGSGVIFTNDGYIVTNNHVIENAEKIEVIHEKKSYQAKIIGTDPSSDIAILKIEAQNLPTIQLGRSKDLQVGEWVIAVGNPFNLTSTVTAGIVSAKGRDIQILGGQFPLESFIQTDAAINPGNSGGALVNINGELVGVNTAILSRTGYYTGYGFAVPVDIVAKVFNDIVQYGEVQKAFLGIAVEDLDSKLAEKYNLNLESFEGSVITSLQSNGVAAQAGLQVGDVITKINEDMISSKSSFEENLSYYRPGDKIRIYYQRGSQANLEAQITLENKEGTTNVIKSEVFSASKLGADLENLSKIERDKFGISNGVRIVKIRNGGLFSRLRLEEGFIILSINKKAISSPQEAEDVLTNASGGRVMIEGINKDGVRGYYSFY